MYKFMYNKDLLKEKENAVILWTGGVDSTLILLDALECDKIKYINTVYLDISYLNQDKVNAELQTRKNIMRILKEKYNKPIEDSIMIVDVTNLNNLNKLDSRFGCFMQPVFWLVYLSPILNKNCSINLGFLKSDDFANYSDQIYKLMEALTPFVGRDISENINFPFIFNIKMDIINKYISKGDFYVNILKNCSYCENQKIEDDKIIPCGHCKCCIEMREAVLSSYSNKIDLLYNSIDINKLIDANNKISKKILNKNIDSN